MAALTLQLRIILVKGFIVELMTAARPPYFLSFRHLEDINQCNLDVEKEYSSFDVSNIRLFS